MARAGTIGRERARSLALLASVLFHAAVLLVLARYLAQTATYPEPRAVQVTLVAPTRTPDAPVRPERTPPRPVEARRPIAPATPADVPPLVVPAPPFEPDPAAQGQRVLRDLMACDPARRLTPEARERCDTRRAQRQGPATARLNLDPGGRYVESDEPFLSRRPRNGCRARATGDTDAMGDSGNVRAGVGCAFSF